jgi:hypothetical protein
MSGLVDELRKRVRRRSQQVGMHTALLELQEAVDAVTLTVAGGTMQTAEIFALERHHEREIEELEHQAEQRVTRAHEEGYEQGASEAAASVSGWGIE